MIKSPSLLNSDKMKRLLFAIEESVSKSLDKYIFEYNTADYFFELAHQVIEIEKAYSLKVENKEIESFTIGITDKGDFWVDIYVKPKTAKYLDLPKPLSAFDD